MGFPLRRLNAPIANGIPDHFPASQPRPQRLRRLNSSKRSHSAQSPYPKKIFYFSKTISQKVIFNIY
jgi:hypothetical protein